MQLTANNVGTVLPCVFDPPPPPPVCQDDEANNFGGTLPCTFDPPPPPPVCTDETATNVGGSLPCTYAPPPVVCSVVSYIGANPFTLENSGDATELAYVQANVSASLYGPVKFEPDTTTSWVSDGNYPVVLVKAGTVYYLYVNVQTGDVLQSQAFNSHGVRQNISHVSKFTCVAPS